MRVDSLTVPNVCKDNSHDDDNDGDSDDNDDDDDDPVSLTECLQEH